MYLFKNIISNFNTLIGQRKYNIYTHNKSFYVKHYFC